MSIRDPGRWMWAEACELLEQAERLHRQFFQPAAGSAGEPAWERAEPAWEPPVDVLEDAGHVIVMVALPGVPPDAVEVLGEPGALIVRARRTPPAELRRAAIRRLEIPYGRIERRIALPVERLELMQQVLSHGCLHIALRKL